MSYYLITNKKVFAEAKNIKDQREENFKLSKKLSKRFGFDKMLFRGRGSEVIIAVTFPRGKTVCMETWKNEKTPEAGSYSPRGNTKLGKNMIKELSIVKKIDKDKLYELIGFDGCIFDEKTCTAMISLTTKIIKCSDGKERCFTVIGDNFIDQIELPKGVKEITREKYLQYKDGTE